MSKYLKTFDFNIDIEGNDTLFDNLMALVELASDVHLKIPLCFINLKRFLSEKELVDLFDRSFSLGISVLLLENGDDDRQFDHECKTVFDQDFFRWRFDYHPNGTSLSQEGIWPKGFGSVTI